MHTKRLAAAGFAMVVALAACSAPGGSNAPSGGGNGSQPQAADQVLRIPLGGEPATLDPNRASDSISITVLTQLVRPVGSGLRNARRGRRRAARCARQRWRDAECSAAAVQAQRGRGAVRRSPRAA